MTQMQCARAVLLIATTAPSLNRGRGAVDEGIDEG